MSHRLKTYDYTPKGRLSRRTWARGATYAYDHRGRMVRKNISHRDTEPQRIEYLWDGWNIIRETTTNLSTFQPFNFSTDYFWGLDLDGTLQGAGGVGGLLAVQRSDCAVTNSAFCILHSALFFPTYDANGDISEYVSTNGEIVAHYDYSPFGEPLVASGPLAATFTHQFSTKPYCPVTGFNEYQMRKYRPEIGRWMSRDPIGESKYYAFAYIFSDNVPICDFDYLGLDSPNLGGPLLPGLTPAPTSPNQLDKPQNCGKPCPCGEGKDSTGTLRCTFVKVSPSITGGPSNFATHQIHKYMHSDNEDRSSKPQCWNPSFCFNEEPTCPEGWTPYGHRSFLTDGIKKVTRTKPAWDFNSGKLSDNCYEMSSTDWVISTSLFLGRWCTKCE